GASQLIWPSEVQLDTPMTYVWSVRALDDAGNPLGDTQGGWAAPFSFFAGSRTDGSSVSVNGGILTQQNKDSVRMFAADSVNVNRGILTQQNKDSVRMFAADQGSANFAPKIQIFTPSPSDDSRSIVMNPATSLN